MSKVNSSNLESAARDLMVAWDDVRSWWRDQKSQEFERHYLEKIPGQITVARQAMEEIDAILRKVRNDCE